MPAIFQSEMNPVKVMIVDDSAFVRYTLTTYLNSVPGILIVGSARSGEEALQLIPSLKPDVITMDVEMPHMDGLTALKHIMVTDPRPVIMLSSLTTEGASETIQALTLGAVDFVGKPSQKASLKDALEEVASKIIQAAHAKVYRRYEPALQKNGRPDQTSKKTHPRVRQNPIVLIGSSTGGPRALNEVIPSLSSEIPASIVVVQHMPARFTRSLAERLNSISGLYVKEAEPGDRLEVGKVLLAPGGFHMTFNENEQVALNQNPPVHGVRPAVDVTLTSLIQRFQQSIIAVILTGMGNDGTNGSVLLHSLGGKVIAEDASSSVVWGMPRSVIEAGAADVVAPLSKISEAIVQAVRSFSPAVNR